MVCWSYLADTGCTLHKPSSGCGLLEQTMISNEVCNEDNITHQNHSKSFSVCQKISGFLAPQLFRFPRVFHIHSIGSIPRGWMNWKVGLKAKELQELPNLCWISCPLGLDVYLGVSKKIGVFSPPNHPFLIGFSIINHPFLGFSPYFWKHPFLGSTTTPNPGWWFLSPPGVLHDIF